jgi:hypothetical protein
MGSHARWRRMLTSGTDGADRHSDEEVHEMSGTMSRVARSVQLAVMATPTTTIVEAVAEARRRHGTAAARVRRLVLTTAPTFAQTAS